MDRRDEILARYRTPPPAAPPSPGAGAPCYIGVQVPETTETTPLVLQRLPAPKDLLALSPATRFKPFPEYEKAAQFSQFQLAVAVDGNMRRAAEPKSPFPSPTAEERQQFMELLGQGDAVGVRRMAWKNPRLLITSDDAPQYFKGTWRQTALHLAVQNDNYPLFCTIMELIESPALMEATRMTPFENIAERGNALVRNFLNNRNKKQEAVLDCAVAYGALPIVDFLTLHPLCDLTVAGRTAEDNRALAGCKRNAHNAPAILQMLEGRWYVPVFGQSDVFPRGTVGDPLPPGKMRDALHEGLLHGFFGPTTLDECRDFRACLGTFTEKRRKSVETAAQGDSVQCNGRLEYQSVEAECRRVAHAVSGPWKEYWGFLQCFTDIRAEMGLFKLEKFLAEKDAHALPARYFAPAPAIAGRLEQIDVLSLYYTHHPSVPPPPPETFLDDGEEVFYTPPSSPEPSALTHVETTHFRGFIGGAAPNSLDHQVFNALQNTEIPAHLWYVRGWRAAMAERDFQADIVGALHSLRL